MNGTQLLNVHAENLAEDKVFSGFWELHRAAPGSYSEEVRRLDFKI